MMVFCHLLNDSSGSPRVLAATIQALASNRRAVLYVGSQGRGVLERVGIAKRRYPYRRYSNRLLTLLSYAWSQVALLWKLSRDRTIEPDAVVYVNTLLPVGAMIWGKLSRRYVIVHVHEVSIRPVVFRKCLVAISRWAAAKLIYVSRDHATRLPIAEQRSVVVPNPVDPQLSSVASSSLRYEDRQTDSFSVLMIASLRRYKGIPEFVEVARRLAQRGDIQFHLVLNADDGEVAKFALDVDGCENITVHGRTETPELYYAKANLLLNLSRVDQWIETFGLTVVEAMSFGVPVIVPPEGGPAEILAGQPCGYCIDSRNIGSVADSICSIADDRELAVRMSQVAYKIASEYDHRAYAARLESILAQLGPSSFDAFPR